MNGRRNGLLKSEVTTRTLINNNNHIRYNYSAVIMIVIARVHPVRVINIGQHQAAASPLD